MFFTGQLVSLSDSQSLSRGFFCRRNSSETAQQILVKLCICLDAHIFRRFWFNFFPGSYAPFEFRNFEKWNILQNSLSAQLLWNCSTEFGETLLLWFWLSFCVDVHINLQEILIHFFLASYVPFYLEILPKLN